MDDELVRITGLYALVNVAKYNAYLRRSVAEPNFMKPDDKYVRVNTLYPATDYNSTWVSITGRGGYGTSFPVDLIERFTNIPPEWDKGGV